MLDREKAEINLEMEKERSVIGSMKDKKSQKGSRLMNQEQLQDQLGTLMGQIMEAKERQENLKESKEHLN